MNAEEPKLFIALYTDEDVSPLLAQLLRQRGFDAISAHEANMLSVDDPEHLVYAASQDRAILSFNRDDFTDLFVEWWNEGRDHAGIIVSQQMEKDGIAELLRQVLNLLDRASADEMRNTIRNLQSYR